MHRLDLGLYSHPKEFLGGVEFEPMLTRREKSPLPENLPQRRIEPATLWTANPNTTNELFRPPVVVVVVVAAAAAGAATAAAAATATTMVAAIEKGEEEKYHHHHHHFQYYHHLPHKIIRVTTNHMST